MARTIVLPAARSCSRSSTSQYCVRGSSAAVGSSKSSTSGFITRTEAIATRFFCPPESWNGARSASSAMSSMASTSSTRSAADSRLIPSCRQPNAISSRTEGEKTCASEFWNTKPTRARKPRLNCSSSSLSSVTSSPNAAERAGVREQQPVEQLEQRGLAAAVGAQQGDRLAGRDGQAHLVERREAFEIGVGQVAALEHVHRRTPRSTSSSRTAAATTPALHTASAASQPERAERPRVAGVAARDHRLVDLFGELVRLAEQRAGAGRDEPPPLVGLRSGRRGCATLRAVYMSSTVSSSRNRYRYAMPMTSTKIFGTPSARSAASSRTHGVVSVSSTTSEMDVATRVMMSPAPCRPCSVMPCGWPCQCHSGRTTSPGVIDRQRGRQHDDAGEDRDEQPDPLDEEAERQPGHGGQARRCRRRRAPAAAASAASATATSRPIIVTSLTRGSSRCSSPLLRGDVVAEDGLPQHARRAGQGLGDEAALAPHADAAARAQPDLGCSSHCGVRSWRCRSCPTRRAGRRSGRLPVFAAACRLPISQATPPTSGGDRDDADDGAERRYCHQLPLP